MQFLIISVKDKVTGEHLQPTFVHNHDESKRLFKYQLESNPIWKSNPEQFELYDLGLLDTCTGNIIGNDPGEDGFGITIHPELICKAQDLLDFKKGE